MVQRAKGDVSDPTARRALEELCRIYQHPIYISLRHKHNFAHHDAEDLTQSFITWLIHSGYLMRADPAKGRFRTFLLSYLDNYVSNYRRKTHAQKRGGYAIHVSADATTDSNREAVEPRDNNTPDKEIDRAWSVATFKEATERLRAKFIADGRTVEFNVLQDFLMRGRGDGENYATAAARLKINEVALRQRVSRFAKKFRDELEWLIRPIVSDKDFEDELSYLWRCYEN